MCQNGYLSLSSYRATGKICLPRHWGLCLLDPVVRWSLYERQCLLSLVTCSDIIIRIRVEPIGRWDPVTSDIRLLALFSITLCVPSHCVIWHRNVSVRYQPNRSWLFTSQTQSLTTDNASLTVNSHITDSYILLKRFSFFYYLKMYKLYYCLGSLKL